jgi:hypothetical protein
MAKAPLRAVPPVEEPEEPVEEQEQQPDEPSSGEFRQGFRDASAGLSRGSWRPTLHAPARARDAGGLLAGLLLYTAVITYIRYGPAGWTGWLSAKFLNKPMQGTAKPATAAGGSAKPGSGEVRI